MRSTIVILALASAAAGGLGLLGACSSDRAARTCTVNADCASGQCRADGTCAPAGNGSEDGGAPDAPGTDGDTTPVDGSADTKTNPPADSGVCTANADGIITVDEVPLRAGLKGTFKATTSDVKVSTAGTASEGGTQRQWDFSAALTGDHTMVLETMPLTGQWFASDYPGATYAARLSDKTDFLGIFAVTPAALELRGIVSPAAGTRQTKIKYDPAISTLSFPLQMGKKWEVTATASGDIPLTFNASYTEQYKFEVDAEGEMKTSSSLNAFKVMRVNVLLKKTPSFSIVSYYTRSYVYVAECFGSIAKVVSAVDQTSAPPVDFTDATEVQRLAP